MEEEEGVSRCLGEGLLPISDRKCAGIVTELSHLLDRTAFPPTLLQGAPEGSGKANKWTDSSTQNLGLPTFSVQLGMKLLALLWAPLVST